MKQFIISTLVVPGLIVGLSGSHHNATVNSAAAQGLAALGTIGAPIPSETEALAQDPLGPFKIQLLGARGFYYLTTPAGFAGLEVETDRVTATSDGTTMVLVILNNEDRVYLLEGGGASQQAEVTPKGGGAAKSIGLLQYTIATADATGAISLEPAATINSRHDLYALLDNMVDTADAKNIPGPAPLQ